MMKAPCSICKQPRARILLGNDHADSYWVCTVCDGLTAHMIACEGYKSSDADDITHQQLGAWIIHSLDAKGYGL
jgi:hypothetical protein